jgi:type VI secretion system protein
MPVKITVRNLDTGVSQTFDLPTSPVRVGRNGLNELALEEGFVSQFHGVIRFAEDGVFFRDLGSTNGSALDGSRLPKNVDVPIKPTSDFRIGPLRLTVEYRPPSVTPLPVGSTKIPTGPHHTVAMFGMPRPGEGAARTGPPGRVSYGPTMQPGGGAGTAAQAEGPGEAVKDLARRVLPAGREPATEADANKLVEAVAVILDAFSHSFVGLRRGVEQTGAELGVRTMTGRSTLHTTKEPRQVLSYLLEGPGKIQTRAQELVAVFADFGVHQVALLNGITESVKALLTRLDPTAGEKKAKLWPFGGGGGDKTAQNIRELLEDDRQLHAAIFGEEFAKAYAAGTLGSDALKGKP